MSTRVSETAVKQLRFRVLLKPYQRGFLLFDSIDHSCTCVLQIEPMLCVLSTAVPTSMCKDVLQCVVGAEPIFPHVRPPSRTAFGIPEADHFSPGVWLT